MNDCQFSDLAPGDVFPFHLTLIDGCATCGAIYETDLNLQAKYNGHYVDGRAYDWFTLLEPLICNKCGGEIVDLRLPCDAGGAWPFGIRENAAVDLHIKTSLLDATR